MKKQIISEQTIQQVVDAQGVVHDGLLDLVVTYCKPKMTNLSGFNYSYKHPNGKESLSFQRPDGGFNWIMNKDGQVFFERMDLNGKVTAQGLVSECQSLIGAYVPPTITTAQDAIMNAYHDKNKGVIKEKPTASELPKYTSIDMNTLYPQDFPKPKYVYMYSRTKIENNYIDQYPGVEATLNAAGYTFTTPDVGSALFQQGKSILERLPGVKYQTMFKTNPPTVWPTGEGSNVKLDKASLQQMAKEFKNKTPKRSDCRAAIKILSHDFDNNGDTILQDDSEVISVKDRVYMCKTRKDFMSALGGVGKELTKLFGSSSAKNPYGMRDYTPTSNVQAESTKNNLQNLIRESLLEIKENKKKSILGESKIVKVRLSIISENVVLKTKKQKNKFFDELLSEMVYLNSQGFDKQVINEGFWDALKGLFGHAPDGIMEYFKEYIGKWLVEHLTPMDPEGWLGNIVITAIGNLAIGDIPKLTDCNFLTKLISKSVAEGTVRKLTHEKGLEGPFYDILRNSIVDMLEETSLGSKIEEGLGNVICPLLGGITTKMNSATDKLKQNALSAA